MTPTQENEAVVTGAVVAGGMALTTWESTLSYWMDIGAAGAAILAGVGTFVYTVYKLRRMMREDQGTDA